MSAVFAPLEVIGDTFNRAVCRTPRVRSIEMSIVDSSIDTPSVCVKSLLPIMKKQEIVHDVVSKQRTVEEVCDECNLHPNTVHQWVSRFKKGKKLRDQWGRPRLLDEESMAKVYHKVNGLDILEETELKDLLRVEYNESRRRKLPEGCSESLYDVELSKMTERNYIRTFGRILIEQECTY